MDKLALKFITAPRKTPAIHGVIDRLVVKDRSLLEPPKAKDIAKLKQVATYMAKAEPHKLKDTAVFTGGVRSSELIKQIHKLRNRDTVIDRLTGHRDFMAQAVSHMTPESIEQTPAAYMPIADTVFQQDRHRGTLIHELGHAIDLNPKKDQGNWSLVIRNAIKPTLVKEFNAWRKGRKAYQSGFALSNKPTADRRDYHEVMRQYNAAKYPAFGSYAGATVGGLVGTAAGVAGAAAIESPVLALGTIGGALGGFGGALGGAAAGAEYARLAGPRLQRKADRQLDKAFASLKTRR